MTDFSKLLNPEQLAAATAPDGPILVLAAAGTGKTRTLVHRVAYLVEKGEQPSRILLLTFTNRAAREMIERAQALVGEETAGGVWSGTFHHVCARFLRRYGEFLGYSPGFRILDADDSKRLIAECVKDVARDPKDFPKKEVVQSVISSAANRGQSVYEAAAALQTRIAGFPPEEAEAVAREYAKRKRALGAMDFDDLLVNAKTLLETNDGVREALQNHFRHVLVDEYQDTNTIQAAFARMLAAKSRNIMAVGDDFQCIYSWRGADFRNIMEFPEQWPGCRIVKLERNYRSRSSILDIANAVMDGAPEQFAKTLRSQRPGGRKPVLVSAYNGSAQAQYVLETVERLRAEGVRLSDIAILYRSHFHSIEIQMALARRGTPIRITSGAGVFDSVHAKDALAFLRMCMAPGDSLAFKRVFSLLPGVGEASAAKLLAKAGGSFDASDQSAVEAVGALLGAKARQAWPALSASITLASAAIAEGRAADALAEFVDRFYGAHLAREFEDADRRRDELQELRAQLANPKQSLEEFLSEAALLTNLDVQNGRGEDRVVLTTVHQAKGMEWPVVILPWLSEGMFPSSKSIDAGGGDEERRLFYVAVTRAKDILYMIAPRQRNTPDGGIFPVEPSRFVAEIPPEMVDVDIAAAPGWRDGSASGGNRYGGGYSGRYGGCSNRGGRPDNYNRNGPGANYGRRYDRW